MPAFLARFRVEVLLLLVAVGWGSTYTAAKSIVSPDGVVALLALRMLLAAGVLAAVLAVRRTTVSRRELLTGIPLGIVLAGVFALETFGLAFTSATNVGVIISLTIVFTPVLESAAARRRVPWAILAASAAAVIGVVLLAGDGAITAPAPGDLLVVGAAVARAIHVTSIHRLTARAELDSAALTTVQLATCAAVFVIASLFTGESLPVYAARLHVAGWADLAYLALVCTVFAFLVQLWAVRRTSPTRVSLLLGTEPIWAALFGILLARDTLGPVSYCGMVIVLAATAWGSLLDRRRIDAAEQHTSTPTFLRKAGT